MSRQNFPQAEDLEDAIEVFGTIKPSRLDEALAMLRLDIRAAAAKTAWESATGWTPFLADTEDAERRFTPQGPNDRGFLRGGSASLWLNGGLVELTELRTGVTATNTGTVLTEGVDFDLWPENADVEGKPWEMVSFRRPQFGEVRSIKITGKFGYAAQIPEDAWQACLDYGLYLCQPQLSVMRSRGLYSIRTLNTETRFAGSGQTPLAAEAVTWKTNFDEAARGYKRI